MLWQVLLKFKLRIRLPDAQPCCNPCAASLLLRHWQRPRCERRCSLSPG